MAHTGWSRNRRRAVRPSRLTAATLGPHGICPGVLPIRRTGDLGSGKSPTGGSHTSTDAGPGGSREPWNQVADAYPLSVTLVSAAVLTPATGKTGKRSPGSHSLLLNDLWLRQWSEESGETRRRAIGTKLPARRPEPALQYIFRINALVPAITAKLP